MFALAVVTDAYERYCVAATATATADEDGNHTPQLLNSVESDTVQSSLRAIYTTAGEEMDVPIESCRIPAVLLYKYQHMSLDERQDFESKVVEAINAKERERRRLKLATKKETSEDFAKGFGGTEADSRNEREAAALLRGDTGTGAGEGSELNPHLTPPRIESALDHIWLKEIGKWKKFTGADCIMYINVLSRDIGNRPADYEDEVEVNIFLC